MSRIGKNPVPLPDGVKVNINERSVLVKGKLGELFQEFPEGISFEQVENEVFVRRSNDSKPQRAFHGLSRALLANMVHGVTEGFKKDLEIVGVGYRAEQRGKALQLSVGFAHKTVFIPPDGIEIKVTSANAITVGGIDKQLVGEVAAKIRAIRKPEPYKGKGIKYVGEYIRRKAGKASAK